MQLRLCLFSVLLFFTQSAFAHVWCGNYQACLTLEKQTMQEYMSIKSKIKYLENKASVPLSDFFRLPNQSVWRMNYFEAENFCGKQGSRLPTARELSTILISMGASGTAETKFPNHSIDSRPLKEEIELMRSNGFHPVQFQNETNQLFVDFYFNNRGAVNLTGIYGRLEYWVLNPEVKTNESELTTAFEPYASYFRLKRSIQKLAVRCVDTNSTNFPLSTCESIATCRKEEFLLQNKLDWLKAKNHYYANSISTDLGDLILDEQGQVKKMTYSEAKKYCKKIGAELPTSRDLALYAHQYGAVGTRELLEGYERRLQVHDLSYELYFPMYKYTRENGTQIDFFFNRFWMNLSNDNELLLSSTKANSRKIIVLSSRGFLAIKTNQPAAFRCKFH